MNVPAIWFKTQRALRTAFAVLTTLLAFWAAFALVAPQILDELALILPGPWIAWLTAAIASVTLVAGVITRVMAIPTVNAWLTRIGLGSVPRSKLVEGTTVDGAAVVTVLPDPKAMTRAEYQSAIGGD